MAFGGIHAYMKHVADTFTASKAFQTIQAQSAAEECDYPGGVSLSKMLLADIRSALVFDSSIRFKFLQFALGKCMH